MSALGSTRARARLSCCALAVALAACSRGASGPADEAALQAIATLDPAFGGHERWRQRLALDPGRELAGDPAAREAWLAELRPAHDAAALARARSLLPGEMVDPLAGFLGSPAGGALVEAETMALTLHRWHGPDAFAHTLARFSDPARTGPEVVRDELADVAAGIAAPSPAALAIAIAASRVEPAAAREIAAFVATPAGRTWRAARAEAFAAAEASFDEFVRAAEARGFSIDRDLDLGRLPEYLPASPPTDPGAGAVDAATADTEVVVRVVVIDPGERRETGDATVGPDGRRYRSVIIGRRVGFVVGDVQCADPGALQRAIERVRTEHASSGGARGPSGRLRIRIEPGPGVFYADLAEVVGAARAAGVPEVDIR